jgi:hypothetical protein
MNPFRLKTINTVIIENRMGFEWIDGLLTPNSHILLIKYRVIVLKNPVS